MENNVNDVPRRRPVRRKKSKLQIFKEVYLPTIIVGITIVLVLWFLIGGAVHRNQPEETIPTTTTPLPFTEPTIPRAHYEQEAQRLLSQAAAAAELYEFDEAISILASFSGQREEFPELEEAYNRYIHIANTMVDWNDPAQVTTLSFHSLIADTDLAYSDRDYANSYKKNFLTTDQFSAMLEQLYEGGYVLVDLFDVYSEVYNESTGKYGYVANTISLPEGKKPLMLVQTNVNYYNYMQTGSSDGIPDGFARRLNADLTTDMLLSDGSTVTGAYDMVPILENFIREHPDFSYQGARAVLGVTGYDGVFGYRINSSKLSDEDLATERAGAAAVVAALQNAGYHIACYTFDNIDYGKKTAAEIQKDQQRWEDEVLPWLGDVSIDILVYAKEGDISDETPYIGSKYNVLYNAGYRLFMGDSSTGFSQIGAEHVRHNRLMVTGAYLQSNPEWYEGILDVSALTAN